MSDQPDPSVSKLTDDDVLRIQRLERNKERLRRFRAKRREQEKAALQQKEPDSALVVAERKLDEFIPPEPSRHPELPFAAPRIEPEKTPTTEIKTNSALIRRFLDEKDGETSRLLQVLEALYKTAKDRKSTQHVAAANAVFDRAYGKSRPSEEEAEAMRKSGIQLVYVAPPQLAGDVEEDKVIAPQPDFLDAEVKND